MLKNKSLTLLIIFLLFGILIIISVVEVNAQTEINDAIRYQIRIFKGHNLEDSKLASPYFLNEITKLYEKNNFKPNWVGENEFTESAYQLREVLDEIEKEGLNPQ